LRTHGEQFGATLGEGGDDFRFGTIREFRRFAEGHSLNQNIFANELALRITSLRRIAIFLDAVNPVEKRGRFLAERVVDFALFPNIKRAFGVRGLPMSEEAVRILC